MGKARVGFSHCGAARPWYGSGAGLTLPTQAVAAGAHPIRRRPLGASHRGGAPDARADAVLTHMIPSLSTRAGLTLPTRPRSLVEGVGGTYDQGPLKVGTSILVEK